MGPKAKPGEICKRCGLLVDPEIHKCDRRWLVYLSGTPEDDGVFVSANHASEAVERWIAWWDGENDKTLATNMRTMRVTVFDPNDGDTPRKFDVRGGFTPHYHVRESVYLERPLNAEDDEQ